MKQSTDFKVTAGLLALTMAIGGAGDSYPLLELLLELGAVAVLGYFVVIRRNWAGNGETRVALVLLALMLLLPLLQLVPVPPGLWETLPGREAVAQLDRLMGWHMSRPWTLDVEGTIRSFLEFLVPAAIFVGCVFLTLQERIRLFGIVVAFAVFGGLLGLTQLLSGGSLTPYSSSHTGYPVGLFVNRNHNAALLLMAIPIVGTLAAIQLLKGRPRLPVTLACVSLFVVFSIVVLGTTSRGGLLLLPLAVAAGLLLLLRRQSAGRMGAPSVAVLGAVALVLLYNGGVTRTLTRFSSLQDDRLNYWTDISWALKQYGLAGTGFGTFVPVFQSAESLESVVPQYINHAHNDFLELLLEGGLPAAVLFFAFVGLIGWVLLRQPKAGKVAERPLINLGATAAVLVIMLFSLVDFPLRMPALSGPFSLLLAALLPTSTTLQRAAGRDLALVERRRPKPVLFFAARIAALILLVGTAVVSIQAGVSARAILDRRYREAASVAPWSTLAYEREATAELLRLDGRAVTAAQHAVRLSPINASSIRTLGLLRMEAGDAYAGNRLMEAAAGLGWRDLLTQFWAIDAAERTGEPIKATQRAEALFRQGIFLPALQLLVQAPDFDPISRLLAGMLTDRPSWRSDLLHSAGGLSAPGLSRFEQVVSRLSTTRGRVTTSEMQPLLQAFASHGRTVEAQRLWLQLNPSLIDNGGFDALEDKHGFLSPAGWNVPSQNADSVTISVSESGSRNRALRIGPTHWVTIVTQNLMLPPGSYLMSYRAREVGRSPVMLRWQLICRGTKKAQPSNAEVLPGGGWQSFTAELLVPPRDCLTQRVALKRVRADDRSETWVDSVRIALAAH